LHTNRESDTNSKATGITGNYILELVVVQLEKEVRDFIIIIIIIIYLIIIIIIIIYLQAMRVNTAEYIRQVYM
jgi:hypothetical protein